MVTIKIIYDNTAFNENLKADWGFAALIEAHGQTILFDTGGSGRILLDNMRLLGINPGSVDAVFISHGHFDHIGGLSHFLDEQRDVTLLAPVSFRGVRTAKEVIYYDEPARIAPGFYTTGELAHIEQALAIDSQKGLVLVVGCAHPPMVEILAAARRYGPVRAVVGGLHGFDRFGLFEDLGLICPTHCTRHIDELQRRFPRAFISGGAGRIIKI